jgi:M6 family metalloprotease-like protein
MPMASRGPMNLWRSCLLGVILALNLFAVPSSLDPVLISQGGGSWNIVQRGDESLHWTIESTSGVPVAYNSTSSQWEVYKWSANLLLVPTGNVLTAGFDFTPFSKVNFPTADLRALKSQKIVSLQANKLPVSPTGSLRHLVVLASFSDHASGNVPLSSTIMGDSLGTTYKSLMNGTSNSVSSYFSQVSRGKLNIQADVTPWLVLPATEASYGSDNTQTTDVGTERLINDALLALDQKTDSGISRDGSVRYDWVTVIHSGSDQARFSSNALASQRMWSSWGKLSSSANIFGGNLLLNHFATAAALGGNNLSGATDLGVLCHELGHLLGVPDLTEYQESGFSVGSWDVMGLGAWGFSALAQQAAAPTPFGAWSKILLGWETPTTLNISGNAYSMEEIHSTGKIYKLPTDNSHEYFLLEYRNGALATWAGMNSTWNGGLIWHIDESAWISPSSANVLHPLAKIEEADGNDSLGQQLFSSQVGDLWSSTSVLTEWKGASLKTGSSLGYGSSYYDRTSTGSSSFLALKNFSFTGSRLQFDFFGPISVMTILDFAGGKVGWNVVEGAVAYDLQRKNGLNGAWGTAINLGNVLSYVDPDISGVVDYYYRVRAHRYTDDLHWSNPMPFSLQVTSAVFDAQEGSLTLNWNLPIKLSGDGSLDLNGLNIRGANGNIFFPLMPSGNQYFTYPYLLPTDSLRAQYTSGNSLVSTVKVWLSDAQRYDYITKSNTSNDNLYLSINASMATAELSSGNIRNPEQSFSGNNAVAVSSKRDIVPPTISSVEYKSNSSELFVYFDEPLYMNSLSTANIQLSGLNGWSTDLTGSTYSVHGNVLTLTLTQSRRIRVTAIEHANAGQLIFNLPSGQVKDFSGVAANAVNFTTVQEFPDTILPYVKSFELNNHDETRILTLSFSEPIFYTVAPTGAQIGFKLCNSDGTLFAAAGNVIGALNGNVTTIKDTPDQFPAAGGQTFTATTGVNIMLTEGEVNAIDDFYGLFANPAPLIYGRLSLDGNYSDLYNYLKNSLVVYKSKITGSNKYTPRRRARLIHPHYDSNKTKVVATQESLIWKWNHRVTFEINGGWAGTEKLRLEWDNTNLSSANVVIAQNLSLSGNLSRLDDHQSVLWDTTKERDALGYRLSIKRQDGLTLYDRSPSLVEIDNTSPRVTISYISNSTPSYKVNADAVVDTSLYNFSLTATEREKSNVIVVATYTEPVIDAPVLTLNQKGSVDPVITMHSASGNGVYLGSGNVDSVFYYAYDVQPQDVGNYTDGTASVSINSVPDRAVGHLAVNKELLSTDSRIEGNRTLNPFSRLTFSIDTIPPTIASLDFYVEDSSIVGENSVLRMYYSENMYRTASEDDATHLVDGRPITGVLDPANYSLSQTGGSPIEVVSVDPKSSGAGPYYLHLRGIVESGVLTLTLNKTGLLDFHGNFVAEPSSAGVVWPGPLHNRNQVLVAPGGRTRLLLSGGFAPYRLSINSDFYGTKAIIDPKDGHSILGLAPGPYTVEVLESRNQLRYVNAYVFNPADDPSLVNAEVSGTFQAFRDNLDFKMVAFPFNLENWDGTSLMNVLKEGAGTFNVDYSLYTYNEQQQYEALGPKTTQVGPGYGFWMAFRKNKKMQISAQGPLPEQVVGIDLHAGWNLVGNPFDEVLQADDIFISTSGSRYSVKDLAQSETEHELWSIDITSPSYRSVTQLEPLQGAWLYVNNPAGTEIIYFRGEESRDYPIDYVPLPKNKSSQTQQRAPALAPPPAPASFDGRASSSGTGVVGGSGGGGGGGCLLP